MTTGDCAGLIHLSEGELESRLGQPVTRRRVGSDTWLIFSSHGLDVRVRCEPDDDGRANRVASWTASFQPGYDTLAQAARAVGLWPVAAPDLPADQVLEPLVRRPLPCPVRGAVYSLTALVREGCFTQLSVFDEQPDWL
ncbi:MAG: hypothetical protein M8841_05325 [marine benthic group bacterium]|nr:hypothetical protein [Gemmatimonadota bacterium]MCL7957937.1 hypothetical protein [Gemmatimonadota bacterium]MCL7970116.1 hypothetical protein [Gemmatimonadota bacterium]MCL7975215.1 hypothetical protein [Gemmatimonadota bacterium]MCL7978438.1 hypothetical protein [Gemmatimonadota bacterium]